jgi:hypothetical protein
MTPEEAKGICPEVAFVKRESGAYACRHRLDVAMKYDEKSELCHHHKHFVCELVLHQIRKKGPEDRKEAGEPWVPRLSVSKVGTMTSCPRKYAFTYTHGLIRFAREPVYYRTGDAFSVGRAKYDAGVPYNGRVREDIPAPDRAKVQAALRFYLAHPPYPLDVWDCEIPVQFEVEGFEWLGFVDAGSKNREHLVEWKYAAQKYDFLRIVRQAAVYMYGVPECRTFELIRFKKPQHKPKKNESWRDFENRVFEGLAKKGPDEVYERLVIERRNIDAERIVRQMVANVKLLPMLNKTGYPPSYSMDCGMCQFKKACEKHVSKPTFLIANLIESGECKL